MGKQSTLRYAAPTAPTEVAAMNEAVEHANEQKLRVLQIVRSVGLPAPKGQTHGGFAVLMLVEERD